jgi:L-seryl-tRNA(Ser) seleniumtransferase
LSSKPSRQQALPSSLRAIPAVERVLQELGSVDLPRPLVTATVRRELARVRAQKNVPSLDSILTGVRACVEVLRRSRLQPVINGTGILVHTNLGRAPLGEAVLDTLRRIGGSYNNLEYDLAGGERGGRAAYLESALALVCGAESATVVNNCAAALLLALKHFTKVKREVVISRGELVQIGGGFRIPDILEASGAKLREVGTTNQTQLRDYAHAFGPETALVLKVHRSNFFMGGFVDSPTTEEIAALARKKRLPFVEDLGSGAAIATEKLNGLEHEPTPAEVLRRGVDLVTFSGDKLFGGPQAGILAGKARLIAALKREPFFRALRCDKLVFSALQTTVELYLEGGTEQQIPVIAMLHTPIEELQARATQMVAALKGLPCQAAVGQGKAQIGGGTLPHSTLPSCTVDLRPRALSLAEFAGRLRHGNPPVIGYIAAGRFKIDLRTVFPFQDEDLIRVVRTQSVL